MRKLSYLLVESVSNVDDVRWSPRCVNLQPQPPTIAERMKKFLVSIERLRTASWMLVTTSAASLAPITSD